MARQRVKKRRKKSRKRKGHRRQICIRKQNDQKGKEENCVSFPQDNSNRAVGTRSMSTFMDNRRVEIQQLFSRVGEDFLTVIVPIILKESTREELKRICFEELNKMSAAFVQKVSEGLPVDGQAQSLENEEKETASMSSTSCSGTMPNPVTEDLYSEMHKDCMGPEGTPEIIKDNSDVCPGEGNELLDISSSEMIDSISERDYNDGSTEDLSPAHDELPSTLYQSSKTKLAKVAPFLIKTPEVESSEPPEHVNKYIENGGVDCQSIELNDEEDEVDELCNGRSSDEESLSEENHDVEAIDESEDSEGSFYVRSRLETQRCLVKVEEKELRARAIRSMSAHVDRNMGQRDQSSSDSDTIDLTYSD